MPNINGPLYYERMGRTGPVMAFVHPNPMDQSCWIYQKKHELFPVKQVAAGK